MGHWNYRVVRVVPADGHPEELFCIMEVYYDDDGHIEGYVEDPGSPTGSSLDELGGDIMHMLQAFAKPVIESIELVQGSVATP